MPPSLSLSCSSAAIRYGLVCDVSKGFICLMLLSNVTLCPLFARLVNLPVSRSAMYLPGLMGRVEVRAGSKEVYFKTVSGLGESLKDDL